MIQPILLRTGLGVGDVLLVTALLRSWARSGWRIVVVESRYPELFLRSRDLRWVVREGRFTAGVKAVLDRRLVWRVGNCMFRVYDAATTKATYPFPCRGQHILAAMADSVGLSLRENERRPFLYLSETERSHARRFNGAVAVQSTSSTYWTPNKDWVPGRMQKVADGLRQDGYQIVQLGSPRDEPLLGATDLRGRTSLRQAATVLAGARLFIGLEGGLVHMARAVETKAVVIYTGYTLPDETGYPTNRNIRATVAGDPCWRRDECEHCRASAEAVTAEEVLGVALDELAKPGRPVGAGTTLNN